MLLQVSGSKFYYLKNEAVMLELALVNWAVSKVMRKGFTPLTTPEIVRSSVVEKCGFQPRGTNTQVCDLGRGWLLQRMCWFSTFTLHFFILINLYFEELLLDANLSTILILSESSDGQNLISMFGIYNGIKQPTFTFYTLILKGEMTSYLNRPSKNFAIPFLNLVELTFSLFKWYLFLGIQ